MFSVSKITSIFQKKPQMPPGRSRRVAQTVFERKDAKGNTITTQLKDSIRVITTKSPQGNIIEQTFQDRYGNTYLVDRFLNRSTPWGTPTPFSSTAYDTDMYAERYVMYKNKCARTESTFKKFTIKGKVQNVLTKSQEFDAKGRLVEETKWEFQIENGQPNYDKKLKTVKTFSDPIVEEVFLDGEKLEKIIFAKGGSKQVIKIKNGKATGCEFYDQSGTLLHTQDWQRFGEDSANTSQVNTSPSFKGKLKPILTTETVKNASTIIKRTIDKNGSVIRIEQLSHTTADIERAVKGGKKKFNLKTIVTNMPDGSSKKEIYRYGRLVEEQTTHPNKRIKSIKTFENGKMENEQRFDTKGKEITTGAKPTTAMSRHEMPKPAGA